MWTEIAATFALYVFPIAALLGWQVRSSRRALEALERANAERRRRA